MTSRELQQKQRSYKNETLEEKIQRLTSQLAAEFMNVKQRQTFLNNLKDLEDLYMQEKEYKFLIRRGKKVFLAFTVTETVPLLVQIVAKWRGYKLSRKKDKYTLEKNNVMRTGNFRNAVWAVSGDELDIIPLEKMDEFSVIMEEDPNAEGEAFGKYFVKHEEYWKTFLEMLDRIWMLKGCNHYKMEAAFKFI